MAEAGLDLFLENLPSLCCVGVALLGVSAGWMIFRNESKHIKVVVADKIKSNAQAARATGHFYEALLNEGLTDEQAREYALHELSHALEDRSKGKKGGKFSYKVAKDSGDVTPQYTVPDARDPENLLRVATAPSRKGRSKIPMSDTDALIAQEARKRIKQKTKG